MLLWLNESGPSPSRLDDGLVLALCTQFAITFWLLAGSDSTCSETAMVKLPDISASISSRIVSYVGKRANYPGGVVEIGVEVNRE